MGTQAGKELRTKRAAGAPPRASGQKSISVQNGSCMTAAAGHRLPNPGASVTKTHFFRHLAVKSLHENPDQPTLTEKHPSVRATRSHPLHSPFHLSSSLYGGMSRSDVCLIRKKLFFQNYCVLGLDGYKILWYHLVMDKARFSSGDKIYWEITDSLGRKFQGIGYLDQNVTFQWLEDFAKKMCKPVWIDIKKIEEGKDIYLLTPVTEQVSPAQEVGKEN